MKAAYEVMNLTESPSESAWRAPYLEAARSQLEEAEWSAAWAEGRAMMFEEAVTYALGEGAEA